MTDQLSALLNEAVSDVEPRFALDEIRARTSPRKRRWPYVVGGAALAVAASITAFAVVGNDGRPTTAEPGTSTSPSPTESSSIAADPVSIYYVGDTPEGPRLFKEVRRVEAPDPFTGVINALELTPSDPDNRNYWPAGSIVGFGFDGIGDDGEFSVDLADDSLVERPAGMDEATAGMAIQQLIYTLQEATDAKAALRFYIGPDVVDRLFGVSLPDPVTAGSPLDTLAQDPLTNPTEDTAVENEEPVEVYYVGDTPDGPRLYHEFQSPVPGPEAALKAGVVAVLTSQPRDPDYRNAWARVDSSLVNVQVVDDVIRIELEPSATQTHELAEAERRAAIEQLVYTAQAAAKEQLPVQFLVDGNPSAEILGLPASEPLTAGPVLDTLALVSLTTPSEGMGVDNDEPLVVEGVGNSFEGNIVTRIQRWEGTYVVDEKAAIAGWGEDALFPFEITFDLTDVPPGDYVVISSTDDPSGQGREHTDSRRITIVD